MIKDLKLQKAVYAIILAVIAFIASLIMGNADIEGSNIVLTISGALLIIGSLMFLYPIMFAKKVAAEEDKVELQPMVKETNGDENVA